MKIGACLVILFMQLIFWVITNPGSALDFIKVLQRQFRQIIAQRTGDQIYQELAHQLRVEARELGISEDITGEVLEEHREEIIEHLGTKCARNLLND